MARVVFFSFDYEDVLRVNQVCNSGRFFAEWRRGFRDKAQLTIQDAGRDNMSRSAKPTIDSFCLLRIK